MSKKIKTLVLALAITATINNPLIARAATYVESSNTLIEQAFVNKTFYDYNMAYAEILKISDAATQEKLMSKLAELIPTVWTTDVYKYVEMLNQLTKTSSGRLYDEMEATINAANLLPIDKGYLLGELTGWGRKLVFTADYTKAVDSLNAAWLSKTDTDIANAENNINLVVNNYSRNYLKEELQKLKNIIGSTNTEDPNVGYTFDQVVTETTNKDRTDYYIRCGMDLSQLKILAQSAINLSQGKDVLEEIKQPFKLSFTTFTKDAQYTCSTQYTYNTANPVNTHYYRFPTAVSKIQSTTFDYWVVYKDNNSENYKVYCIEIGV